MRRVPLPGWVLGLSLALFTATWIAAPGEIFSEVRAPDPALPRARPTQRALPLRGAGAAPLGERPDLVWGHNHPFEVALTFDDGPHPVYTAQLLDILARHEVKAAFFVNGIWLTVGQMAPRTRFLMRRAHFEGHLVGNHTYSHANLAELDPKRQTWEIVANAVMISDILGQRPYLFRPPYGSMTPHAAAILQRYGYVRVMWNLDAPEAVGSPKAIATALFEWILRRRGGIVLLHDRVRRSVIATELLLDLLTQENCRRLAERKPIFRLVSLDAFLLSPQEKRLLANNAAVARQRQRLRRVCPR